MINNDSTTAQQINNSLGKIMAIKSLIEGKELTANEQYSLKGIKVFNDFLESPLNSSEESNLKKAFTAAVMVSRAIGKIKLENNYTTEDITIAISGGLTRLKSQYLAGKGEYEEKTFNAKMAEDVILDHEIAALALLIERKIDEWCEGLPNNIEELTDEHYDELVAGLNLTISAIIATHFSPELAAQVSCWINEVAVKLRPTILNLINKGTKLIVDYVKPKIIEYVKKLAGTVQKIKNTITGKKQSNTETN